ncbi:hypothetical protein Z042_02415 [Chania multitudinisentens RB-25]|uniref:Uncharacterized protein n=1 Tax=Chania multitudinisentens RB-25 TaxID=1441930 RepID=W0L9C2_9GAMM|nr:extracellular solute-binding protein [Chania multitudinisentens]AHG18600.1 hypothetical protein Z042_02415 [Chania multitudinisentens RB-25]
MATIKDVAKLAGVSHGTVSNVLNGRGNVSVEKVEAVMRAAQQMGYELNTQAQLLRAKSRNAVAIVLPNINTEQHYQLYTGLHHTLRNHFDGELDLHLTDDIAANERAIIKKLAGKGYQTIITVSCLTRADEYYHALKLPQAQILFVYRKPQGAKRHISLDYSQVARDIGDDILRRNFSTIGILTDPITYHYVDEFIRELNRTLGNKSRVIVCSSPAVESYKTAFDFFRDDTPDAIIAMDKEKNQYVLIANTLGNTANVPALYILSDNAVFMQDEMYCYQMSYNELGVLIAKSLNATIPTALPAAIRNRGFSQLGALKRKPSTPISDSLNILLLPSPSSDALNKLLPHFYKQTGLRVRLVTFPYDELFDILSHLESHPYYDVLRLDIAVLPWFAQRILTPLDGVLPDLPHLLANYDKHVVDMYGKVNQINYAIPFDASSQLLFYRRDLFDDTMICRMFYERHGYELQVPETFQEFDTIAAFFTATHQPGNLQRPMGTSMTLGNSVLIATEYLTRYYAMGGRLLHEDHPPSLDVNIAIPVLRDYLHQLTISTPLHENWWSAAVKQFEQGGLAMQIAYMNLFNDVAHSPLLPALGYASVPGGIPQLGGGSLGLSRYSTKHREAALFFNWLYSEEIVEHRVLLGGSSARKSICLNQRITQQYPWFTSLSENVSKGLRESCWHDGSPFNLRHAEMVIGQGISYAINKLRNIEQTIDYINQRLAEY